MMSQWRPALRHVAAPDRPQQAGKLVKAAPDGGLTGGQIVKVSAYAHSKLCRLPPRPPQLIFAEEPLASMPMDA